MKKALVTLVAAVAGFGCISQAFAYDHHHHRVCHRERIHHHWVNRCR